MTSAKDHTRDDKTARERRKKLSNEEIRDLELAGGVEGGMQAGSAGGPGEDDSTVEGGRRSGDDRR
jgi:hypothetical protein